MLIRPSLAGQSGSLAQSQERRLVWSLIYIVSLSGAGLGQDMTDTLLHLISLVAPRGGAA